MQIFFRIGLGWCSLAVGMVGLVLPVLQGWFFLVLGVLLLSRDIRFFKAVLVWTQKRFRFTRPAVKKFRSWFPASGSSSEREPGEKTPAKKS